MTNEFNNIPIRVFFKKWDKTDGRTRVLTIGRREFSNLLCRSGKLKTNIYKYTEDYGRVQLEESYECVNDLTTYIRNKFKQYTREQGIVLDMEFIA